MKKFLNRVTITGLDFVAPATVKSLSERYPFVEWGILFHPNRAGSSRYPSNSWLQVVYKVFRENHSSRSINFSAHICGKFVRDICQGNWTFFTASQQYLDMFSRIQLNFSPYVDDIVSSEEKTEAFLKGLDDPRLHFRSLILQLNSKESVSPIVDKCLENNIDVCVLNDASGGKGVCPENWNIPIVNSVRQGFAGGLTPENLNEQLEKLSELNLEFNPWIDVESGVRNGQDCMSLEKVDNFLSIAKDWVSPNFHRN